MNYKRENVRDLLDQIDKVRHPCATSRGWSCMAQGERDYRGETIEEGATCA